MSRVDTTRAAILDAAESLFAAANVDIVGMRDVAAKAGVPLGLICYHFRTKYRLYEAVIARRSDELRLHQLRAFERLPAEFELHHVIDACLRPYIELMREPGWCSYGRLVAQAGQQHNGRLLARYFKQNQNLILDALTRAESRLSKEAVARGYVFMRSVIFGMLTGNDLLSMVSDRAYSGRDLEAAYAYAMPFLIGAFEGLSTTEPVKRSKA